MSLLHYKYPLSKTQDGAVRLGTLEKEIKTVFPRTFAELAQEEDGSLSVFFSAPITRPLLCEIVENHWGVESLAMLKSRRYQEIDGRTEELILEGFVYDTKTISSSANAQSKWHAIFNMAQIGQITYPLLISAKDEAQVSLADASELYACYGAMVGTGKAHFDAGKLLKDAVLAAVDADAVNLVVDSR